MSKWLLSISILGLTGALGVTWVGPMVTRSEQAAKSQASAVTRLTHELSTVQAQLANSQATLARIDGDLEQQGVLQNQISSLATELRGTRAALEQQSLELAEVEERQGAWVRQNLADLNQNLESRWKDVSRALNATAKIAAKNRDSFDHLQLSAGGANAGERNIQLMWTELMGPTVQLSDDSTVGTGILLQSKELDPEHFQTHVLTAWHVVRDIIHDATDGDELLQIYVYEQSGSRRLEWATLVDYNAGLDAALLLMKSKAPFKYGAKLPLREQLDSLGVFATIYAVGCPLGNDPIPTYGEIADTHHEVEGSRYWMINAPTYIGNSGGGIFSSEGHELLGIFSKIYTHGNLRPTVIPHMGLVTPLSAIYDWLEESGNGFLIPR